MKIFEKGFQLLLSKNCRFCYFVNILENNFKGFMGIKISEILDKLRNLCQTDFTYNSYVASGELF